MEVGGREEVMKMSANDNLKVVDLPKRKQKILSADDCLEIARLAQELALYASDVENLDRVANYATKFFNRAIGDFITAKELRDSAQKDFIKAIEKIINR